MKQIIIPIDFSDNAWNALFTALKLYARTNCKFLLLNAYEPRAADLLGNKNKERLAVLYESMDTNANTELDKVLQYLSKNHSNDMHHFEKMAVSDDLLESLKGLLLKRDIDLIVMGTQGASGAIGVFIGSNTVQVLRKVRNCPVLAVPESYNFQALKKVVFPTDFTRHFDPGELQPLLELLEDWKAELMVLYLASGNELDDEQQAVKKLLIEKLQGLQHSFYQEDLTSDLSAAFAKYARGEGADMIALVHYKHSFMEQLTREPVISHVAFSSRIPFLVLPDVS
jgi:nucleotide-binding universal stress UspA family protein